MLIFEVQNNNWSAYEKHLFKYLECVQKNFSQILWILIYILFSKEYISFELLVNQ